LLLLLFLYVLQGVPLGLSGAIPLMLKEMPGIEYSDLGTFSLASWPFSVKLLWAPLVDSVFLASVGRRKTWIIPMQFMIGVTLVYLWWSVDAMLESKNVVLLTVMFGFLYFLCATQDVAVDGWGLTLLRKENVGYAATANAVGQSAGFAMALLGYMSLSSYDLVDLAGFMLFWGVLFFLSVFIVLLKHEAPVAPDEEIEDIKAAYLAMYKIIRLPAVGRLLLVLLTCKMCFSVADNVSVPMLQDQGLPKQHLAALSFVATPISIVLPSIVARYTAGPRPLDLFVNCYIPRLVLAVASAGVVFYAPTDWEAGNLVVFYGALLTVGILGTACGTAMFVSHMAFFARIADPSVGGTYMTLVNSVSNFGSAWPAAVVLKLMTWLKGMTPGDPFYVLVAGSAVAGMGWLMVMRGLVERMQAMPLTEWRVDKVDKE